MKWFQSIAYSILGSLMVSGCAIYHPLSFITPKASYSDPVIYCYTSPIYNIKVSADDVTICPNPEQFDYYAAEALFKLSASADILKDIHVFVRYGTVKIKENSYAKGLSYPNGIIYIRSEPLWYRTLQHEITHIEIFKHPDKYKQIRVWLFFHQDIKYGDPEHKLKYMWRKIDNRKY